MRTRPPCKTPDGIECQRRYVGCRAGCEKYHEWLAIHDAELARERQARDRYKDTIDFLATQGERTRNANRRTYMREYNGRFKK